MYMYDAFIGMSSDTAMHSNYDMYIADHVPKQPID